MRQPLFFYDLAGADAYLAAERVNQTLPEVPEWRPILASALPGGGGLGTFRCAEEKTIFAEELSRRARERGMQPLRWPPDWPGDSEAAMRAATYAKQIGRAVAFSLAAFRQAFAGGRALDEDTVLLAAAACEIHPSAMLKALGRAAIADALGAATAEAAELGVRTVPAVVLPDGAVHEGDLALDALAA